jgi:hypothetical protein
MCRRSAARLRARPPSLLNAQNRSAPQVKLQSQSSAAAAARFNGPLDAVKQTLGKEGLRGLYRGERRGGQRAGAGLAGAARSRREPAGAPAAGEGTTASPRGALGPHPDPCALPAFTMQPGCFLLFSTSPRTAGMAAPLATVALFNAVLFSARGQAQALLAHDDGGGGGRRGRHGGEGSGGTAAAGQRRGTGA